MEKLVWEYFSLTMKMKPLVVFQRSTEERLAKNMGKRWEGWQGQHRAEGL